MSEKIESTEKIPAITEIITEKRYRGCRGPDKQPRKFNTNSLFNLKPFRINAELSNDNIQGNTGNVISISSKILVGALIFILIIIVGAIIWKIYRDYKENKLK